MTYRDMFKDEVLDDIILQDLLEQSAMLEQDGTEQDAALARALHVVIAFYSVPGTYMEGAYD
jgi:hypothetical protein